MTFFLGGLIEPPRWAVDEDQSGLDSHLSWEVSVQTDRHRSNADLCEP